MLSHDKKRGWILWIMGLFLWAGMVSEVDAQTWTLAFEGTTEYRILLPAEPTLVEQTAATELQSHLKQITTADFPIVNETDGLEGKFLSVGRTNRATQLVDFATFRDDEIWIQSQADGTLFLAGHPQRGTLYAVYTFLEDYLGVRWWTDKASSVPQAKTLTLEPVNHRYAPKLIYRESYNRAAFPGVFAARCKCNGNMAQITPEYGDHYRYHYFVHSFAQLISVMEYAEHPDWFPEIDGVRKVGYPSWAGGSPEQQTFLRSLKPEQWHEAGTQLCLANDTMRKVLTERVLEGLRKNPKANIVSISQNDWRGYCQCEKCKALDDAEGSPAGSLIHFVNQVAEDIEKEFPHVWVDTLAYQYTRKPPKTIRPRHNVIVRLCTIECSFLHPLADDVNASLRDDIRGWSAVAPQLFVWDYVTNFANYLLPHPNMRVLAQNIRFFLENKTIGLFEQGDAHTTVSDFLHARNWVVSHLLWNPELDEKALWDTFFTNYYGAAGPKLQTYLDFIHDTAEKKNVYLTCFRETSDDWLDVGAMNRAAELANAARDAVREDAELLRRVNVALFSLDLNVLQHYDAMKSEAEKAGQPFHGPADPLAATQALFTLAESEGTQRHRETGTQANWDGIKKGLLDHFSTPKP